MEPEKHNNFAPGAELPSVESTPVQNTPEQPAPAGPERRGMQAPATIPPHLQPLTPVASLQPATPVPVSTSPPATPMAATPLMADDGDLIEKEWVLKAKAIVAATKDDPYNQNREITKVKADYLKKRYNKDLRLSESQE